MEKRPDRYGQPTEWLKWKLPRIKTIEELEKLRPELKLRMSTSYLYELKLKELKDKKNDDEK